eukprot:852586-Prorocentrum_minimum.AAC.1
MAEEQRRKEKAAAVERERQRHEAEEAKERERQRAKAEEAERANANSSRPSTAYSYTGGFKRDYRASPAPGSNSNWQEEGAPETAYEIRPYSFIK